MKKPEKNRCRKQLAGLLGALCMLVLAVGSPAAGSQAQAATHYAAGIDVSKYQGAINWQAVKDDGVQFALVRVGSTEKGIDEQFVANMKGANAVGMRTGVYFYSYAKSVEAAQAEATMVLNAIAPYTVSFPVAIDYEDSSLKGISPQDQATIVTAFCDVIAAAGYYPMVYSYRNWFQSRLGNIKYDKWIAQYSDKLEYNGEYTMWQSSSHGQIKGIGYRVDVNHLYKDLFNFIIPEGFTTRGDKTYLYINYRKQYGWVEYNGERYVCEPSDNGAVQTGWFQDSLGWHYLDPAQGGKLLTGLQVIGKDAYLLDSNGIPYVGWSGQWPELYCFGEDGKMIKNTKIAVGGVEVTFGKDGRVTAPENFDPSQPQPQPAPAPEAAQAAEAAPAAPAQ
ncbi:MAG: hypothetical protein K6G16_11465 [Lachnospiraceae bacterium]|nr:hypothetical protein [Lachnospiraceae bacterium]